MQIAVEPSLTRQTSRVNKPCNPRWVQRSPTVPHSSSHCPPESYLFRGRPSRVRYKSRRGPLAANLRMRDEGSRATTPLTLLASSVFHTLRTHPLSFGTFDSEQPLRWLGCLLTEAQLYYHFCLSLISVYFNSIISLFLRKVHCNIVIIRK